MSEKIKTNIIVVGITTGSAILLSLYLYLKREDSSYSDNSFDGFLNLCDDYVKDDKVNVGECKKKGGGNIEITENENIEGKKGYNCKCEEVKPFLYYDLYNELLTKQKLQKNKIEKLENNISSTALTIEQLQNIVSNLTITTNVRLQRLEMKNPECSFFDNNENVVQHINENVLKHINEELE